MKAIFSIPEETQVQAIKVFVMPVDPNDTDPILEGCSEDLELEMGVNVTLVPGKEYDVFNVVDASEGVTIWLTETLYIPDFPKEKVQLI